MCRYEICDAPSRADHLEDATDLESEPALSQGSSWSQTSEGQQQLSSGIHVLNEQIVNLSTGNTSPIKYQLQQPLKCVQDSTKRYLKRKATEVILTMLHYITPGQSSVLFRWLMDDSPDIKEDLENSINIDFEKVTEWQAHHRSFTNLFGKVKQDWFAVASALEHTLTTIKEQMPQIQEVFLRSDNAGCYHCGCLWLSLQGISERTGIRVTRYDFSEAQSGKSICDAKIAHMRLKMRMYVSSGRNITSPFEMQAAIMDGTGVKACQCAVVEVDSSKQTMTNHRIKGINQMNNIAFDGDDIIVWQAFNVGIGIKMQRSKLLKNEQLDTGLKILSNFEGAQQIDGNITKKSKENTTGNTAEPIEQSVFYCTELGCTMQFSINQGLQDHIDLSRHTDEKMSTYDHLRHRWVATCQANLFSSREILRRTTQETEQHHSVENDIQYGWALKKEKKFVRFSCKVKEFLQKTYQDGEVSERKANPSDVSQNMKSLRKDNEPISHQ
ncbi:uncharacterized protein LOC127711994 [Mytilus californianus]|uniref:uncharacterized protein LOC127711994 n=1 Tax=Mytilus californianus TaxID=6549 RepID=UPI002247C203|nr:uncharacterized protein LOC127711994 [Mytilus californianus]